MVNIVLLLIIFSKYCV